jgi:aspartyl-tRNA(Asn)/glutamyl-tRNA(Gln) amidotransferase subunit A
MTLRDLKNMGDPQTRVSVALEAAHAVQSALNAMVSFIDPQPQLDALAKVDPQAPFYGIPIALKDLVNMKDTRTTGSSKILDNYISPYDATITRKLREAGAIIIGKASCDTFGMGGTNKTAATGPVHNPYDLSRMSGGSSGGSAALVAAGVVPMAIGTDTGDSIRKPAAFTGIVGLKPTYGRISRYGVIPYASSLDHVGCFTRNVTDAAITLKVLAGRDDLDMTSSDLPVEDYPSLLSGDVKGKRIGVLSNVIDAISNPIVKAQFDALCAQLTHHGAIITRVSLNDALMKALLPTYYIIANAEATANHANLDSLRFGVQVGGANNEETMRLSRTAGFGPLLRKRFVIGSYALFVENQEKLFRKAQKVRRLVVENLSDALCHIDVLMAPASGGVAPLLEGGPKTDELSGEYLIAENYMVLGNFSGYPSITLPMGFEQGLPLGVNLTAKAFDEVQLLDIAYGIETLTGLKDLVAKVNT